MNTKRNPLNLFVTAVAFGLLVAIPPAFGHHVMEGALPSSSFEGLISGLSHPVIGMDHLAFIVALGLIAALHRPAGVVAPSAFVIATIGGATIHLTGWTMPLAEAAMALSVIAAGAILFARSGHVTMRMLAAFTGISGVFHGYAYGESIVGAEPTPLFAYLAGFSIIQVAIGMAAYAVGVWTMKRRPAHLVQAMRLSGTAVSLLGVGFLVGAAA